MEFCQKNGLGPRKIGCRIRWQFARKNGSKSGHISRAARRFRKRCFFVHFAFKLKKRKFAVFFEKEARFWTRRDPVKFLNPGAAEIGVPLAKKCQFWGRREIKKAAIFLGLQHGRAPNRPGTRRKRWISKNGFGDPKRVIFLELQLHFQSAFSKNANRALVREIMPLLDACEIQKTFKNTFLGPPKLVIFLGPHANFAQMPSF